MSMIFLWCFSMITISIPQSLFFKLMLPEFMGGYAHTAIKRSACAVAAQTAPYDLSVLTLWNLPLTETLSFLRRICLAWLQIFFPWKDMRPTKSPFWMDKTKVRSEIILQYCSICEPANLRNVLSMQNIAVCTGKQKKKKYKIKKKIVVRIISLTTVGISSDISKLWSASVRCPAVICSPNNINNNPTFKTRKNGLPVIFL